MSLRRTLFISGMVLTMLLSAIYYLYPRPVDYLTLKSLDLVSHSGREGRVPVPVVSVVIDDLSLEKYGQWPWPRHNLARLLKTIAGAGALSIGVDIFMPEKERAMVDQAWREGIDSDASLAAVLKEGPFVLGYTFLFSGDQAPGESCQLHPVSPIRVGKKGVAIPYDEFHNATEVLCSHEILTRSAAASGFLNGSPDSDGLLRRLPLLVSFEDKLYPSFPLAVLQVIEPSDNLTLSRDSANVTILTVGGIDIATDNSGNVLLGRSLPGKRSFSAAAVLEGRVSPDVFKDAIVLVGMTAAGLSQEYATPASLTTPAIEIYRQAVEAMLAGQTSIRTSDFPGFEAVLSLVVCFCLILTAVYLPIPWSIIYAVLVSCLAWLAAGWIYRSSGYLFSPLLPTVAVTLNTFLLLTLRYRHLQYDAREETDDALKRLHVREQDLAAILHSVPDIIYRLDPEGRITFISPAVERYGVTIRSLLGKSIFDLVASSDINRAKYRLNERRTGERATSDLEVRLRLGQGGESRSRELNWFSISAEGIFRDNGPDEKVFLGTQGIIRDITEHRQLEQQLMKAQKLEVIGNLAARVAHDLNNILAGLVSYPDLLLHEIPEDDPMHAKISIIQKSGRKAAVIVQDLLTLARRNVQANEPCDMGQIVADYLKSVELKGLLARFPDTVIEVGVQDNLMKVVGSEVHLSKVVMNIVNNAVEAMPEGGRLTIATANTYVDRVIGGFERIPEGEYVRLTVADTGVGIAADELPRIFEPFYTKKGGEASGTGLGMTIIWATVKDHGGFLDIDSRPGEGTTLRIYLPASRNISRSMDPLARIEDYQGRETILVVDDDEDQLEIARTMLGRLGYRVLTGVSGEEAIRVVGRQPVDLVLLDMVMPGGLDGLATCREILQLKPEQRVVATSGSFNVERAGGMRELGITSFLEKPYTLAGLGASIRQELDRRETR